jgi:predicted ATPase
MRHLPAGTVTFVFTDVEGSTRLLLADDERYAASLIRHRELVRTVFGRHGGLELDTQGDAFFYVFSSARSAVAAADEAQQALSGVLATRMGLHTGEARVTEEGYVGIDVHRAARISAAAHGGQVLMSQSTRDLVGVDVVDLGLHRLKDLPQPERLFQLGTGEFPPLRTRFQSTLPIPPAPLVGRQSEIREVHTRLTDRSRRMITLTGAGGSGKTRLAIAAANAAIGEFPEGVWWVSLAGLHDPALVLPTISRVLGTNTLAASIGDGRRLLVLDNMEQVASAGEEIAALLQSCPGLTALITSRMRLAVAGEREYVVAPLITSEASDLFRAAAPGDTTGPVDEVCARLDGLPLAIELVAARTKTMSVAQIRDRLEPRIPLLAGGPRDAPARQKTLRATLDWSYDLLDQEEQTAFARLSVFAGGCTLDSAEAVCNVSPDLVSALVDKSLLVFRDERLRMLETTREYALEILGQAGEAHDLNHRLGRYLADIAERAWRDRDYSRKSIAGELRNLRAVMAWALTNEPVLALVLAGYGDVFGTPPSELRDWMAQALAYDGPVDSLVRARAMGAAVSVAGTFQVGLDPALLEPAEELLRGSLVVYRDTGDRQREASTLASLAQLASLQGADEHARARFDESLTAFRALDDARGQFHVLNARGEFERDHGDLVAAERQLTRALALAREINDLDLVAIATHGLGDVAREDDDLDGAITLYEEALRTAPMTRSGRWTACYCLAALASVAGVLKDAGTAGWRWGAYEALEETNGLPLHPAYRSRCELPLADLEPSIFQAAVADGRTEMTDQIRSRPGEIGPGGPQTLAPGVSSTRP